ncbi:phospholipid carrier-dependent glycosyltransferase [Phormidesmis sp. 146-12]
MLIEYLVKPAIGCKLCYVHSAIKVMLANFSFLLACIALSLPAWFTASWVFRYQPVSGALAYLYLFLIQISVVELVLGILNFLNPISLCLGAILAGLVSLLVSRKLYKRAKSIEEIDQANPIQISQFGTIVLGAIALILFIPLYPFLSEWLIQIFRVHPLSWDVVSYHLPNVLNYLQTGSLWDLKGTFGGYPGGNELLQIWSFLPLKSDSLLGMTAASISLGVLLASTLLLKSVLPNKTPFELGCWTLLLWVGCLLFPPLQEMLVDFGRNDITLAFWLLVAIWSLQQASQTEHRKGWLLSTGISLGFAIGTKPNGLFYLVGFLCLFFARFFPSNPQKSKGLESSFIILPALLMGGFWYFRNLIQAGTLSPDFLEVAVGLSLAKNLFNPALYQLNFSLVFFLLSVGMTAVTIARSTFKPLTHSLNLKLLAGLNSIALFALILTPSGAGFLIGDRQLFLIQIRYSAVIIPVTLILSLYFIAQWLNNWTKQLSLDRLHTSQKRRSTALFLTGINLIGAILLTSQLLSYQPAIGLPGYDGIFFPVGEKPSKVYEWVQKNLTNTVIYSIGLRPYGLYGFPFSNRVVYQLDSLNWKYQNGLKVIRDAKPNYIAISLDPFTRAVPADLQSLTSQPQAFELIYQDDLALVFRITPVGQALADR